MLTLTFEQFHKGEFDEMETDYELYIIKRGNETLYVGISERGVWNRWFDQWGGHIMRNGWGEYFANSHIGRVILDNMPESQSWIVELWTLEDCARLFGKSFDTVFHRLSLRHAEKLMINHLRPSLNVMNAPYHKKLFE